VKRLSRMLAAIARNVLTGAVMPLRSAGRTPALPRRCWGVYGFSGKEKRGTEPGTGDTRQSAIIRVLIAVPPAPFPERLEIALNPSRPCQSALTSPSINQLRPLPFGPYIFHQPRQSTG